MPTLTKEALSDGSRRHIWTAQSDDALAVATLVFPAMSSVVTTFRMQGRRKGAPVCVLVNLSATPRRAGLGSYLLKELLRWADAEGAWVALNPTPELDAKDEALLETADTEVSEDSENGLEFFTRRLVRWYERFGFVLDREEGSMHRPPVRRD